jgi:hypothetical protein
MRRFAAHCHALFIASLRMMAVSGAGSESPVHLLSGLPELWYNSVRVDGGKLDSSPVQLVLQVSGGLAKALRTRAAADLADSGSTIGDALSALLSAHVLDVDVVFWDGEPVTVFAPAGERHETLVDAPKITRCELEGESLRLWVSRRMPLSSAHGEFPAVYASPI